MYMDEDDLSLYYALLKGYDTSNTELISSKENLEFEKMKTLAEKCEGIVLYGAGVMFEYFINSYEDIPIKYVVDIEIPDSKVGRRGLFDAYPISKLKDEDKSSPILVTPVKPAREIYNSLVLQGFKNIFILSEMEFNREEVKNGVAYLSEHPEIQNSYLRICRRKKIKEQIYNRRITALENQLNEAKQQLKYLKERGSYYYKYILHCNNMVDVLIDELSDSELRRELIEDQIKFRFCTEFKNDYIPDLENPQSFNEKNLVMQIREADNPLFATVTDKYELKKYVTEKIGEKYIVPALGVWDDPKDIEWDKLSDNTILKATNGGDSNSIFVIYKNDKETREKATKTARKWIMKTNSVYYAGFNGVFRHVPQRILAEKNIEINEGDLLNYKIWMFHGEAKFYYISKTDLSKKSDKTKITYFKMNGEPFEARMNKYPPLKEFRSTTRFKEMIHLAEILSEPFEFVRVDFMETPEQLVVSELTLTPDAGLRPFDTCELDYEIGKYW